uniref:Aquaporin n=1 Tax=Globisporangium ultimum (strain ATCC 200006 / CBS 805.95 / DAOM BR144) TaxID=431595 RepID=K3W8E0_GLOUD
MTKDSQVDKTENGYMDIHDQDEVLAPRRVSALAVKSAYLRECLAEFIGTAVMIAFGDGVVAQVVLGKGANGDYTHISLCWGIAVFFGIHFSGGVSGAHLNPSVTFTLALFKRFEWRKVPGYVLAQMLGAFFGAFLVYVVYYPYFNHVDPDRMTTQGVFATYPTDIVSNYTAFLTEVIATAILLGGIFAVGDQKNKPASPYTSPAAVAILVIGIGMAFGMNSGYALNPARDFGPRVFSACAGWGSKVFTLRDHYFWIPIVAPLIGGAIGGATYMGLVEIHHPQQ